jgi:hypothetical protein
MDLSLSPSSIIFSSFLTYYFSRASSLSSSAYFSDSVTMCSLIASFSACTYFLSSELASAPLFSSSEDLDDDGALPILCTLLDDDFEAEHLEDLLEEDDVDLELDDELEEVL